MQSNDRIKKLKLSSIFGLTYQVILIISGFILPKFFLRYYGSSVYGLVSSITQFLSFINICDLGIGAVVSSALYKPLADDNTNEVSRIYFTAKKYFRVVSYILVAYVVILIFVYPNIVANEFDLWFTVSLILAMCISQFSQYFLGISYQILINADQKSYIQYIINGLTLLINTLLCVLLMINGCNIQLVKLSTSIIYLFRPLLMALYVRKYYKLDKKIKPDFACLPQKSNGIIQHISYMVYENTDVIVLTCLSSLANVAIYNIYFLVVNSIKTMINSLTNGFLATFGNIIAKKEMNYLNSTFNTFEWFLHTIGVMLFTITGILIVPFVLIYTNGIEDANYNVPLFAILIIIAGFMNLIRNGYFTLIKAAGHYKQTQKASLIETILNVLISVVLVFNYGLVGVAIGTIVSTVFFVIYETIYLHKNILNRKFTLFLKQCFVDIIIIFLIVLSTSWMTISTTSYGGWIINALEVTGISLVIVAVIEFILNRENIHNFYITFIKK